MSVQDRPAGCLLNFGSRRESKRNDVVRRRGDVRKRDVWSWSGWTERRRRQRLLRWGERCVCGGWAMCMCVGEVCVCAWGERCVCVGRVVGGKAWIVHAPCVNYSPCVLMILSPSAWRGKQATEAAGGSSSEGWRSGETSCYTKDSRTGTYSHVHVCSYWRILISSL